MLKYIGTAAAPITESFLRPGGYHLHFSQQTFKGGFRENQSTERLDNSPETTQTINNMEQPDLEGRQGGIISI